MPSSFQPYQSGIEASTGNLVSAYSAMAQRTASAISGFGEDIAKGIEKYSQNKQEDEMLTAKNEAIAGNLLALKQALGDSQENAPISNMLNDLLGSSGKVAGSSLTQKRALLGKLELGYNNLIPTINQFKALSEDKARQEALNFASQNQTEQVTSKYKAIIGNVDLKLGLSGSFERDYTEYLNEIKARNEAMQNAGYAGSIENTLSKDEYRSQWQKVAKRNVVNSNLPDAYKESISRTLDNYSPESNDIIQQEWSRKYLLGSQPDTTTDIGQKYDQQKLDLQEKLKQEKENLVRLQNIKEEGGYTEKMGADILKMMKISDLEKYSEAEKIVGRIALEEKKKELGRSLTKEEIDLFTKNLESDPRWSREITATIGLRNIGGSILTGLIPTGGKDNFTVNENKNIDEIYNNRFIEKNKKELGVITSTKDLNEQVKQTKNNIAQIEADIKQTDADKQRRIEQQAQVPKVDTSIGYKQGTQLTSEDVIQGGDFVVEQQIRDNELRKRMQDYFIQTRGYVPAAFESIFKTVRPPSPIVDVKDSNGNTVRLIRQPNGKFDPLPQEKPRTAKEISEERMFVYGARDGNGNPIINKKGNYEPEEVSRGSGVYASGQISGDATTVREIRDNINKSAEAIRLLEDEIIPAFERKGIIYNPEVYKDIQPALVNLRAAIRPKILGTGSQSDLEFKQLIENTPDPSKWFSYSNQLGGELANAKALVRMMKAGIESEASKGQVNVEFRGKSKSGQQSNTQLSALKKIQIQQPK